MNRERRTYSYGGNTAGPSGLSPEEYEARLRSAIERYGDVALAFNPETGQFEPGRQVLGEAEVEGKFVPKTKEEFDAYSALGAQGGIEMRNMQRGITKDRNRFAEDFMVPAAEAALNFTSVGKAGQIAGKAAKFFQNPAMRRMLSKQIAKKSAQLGGKKYAEKTAKSGGL